MYPESFMLHGYYVGSVMTPSISIVINTLNEEANLPYAIRSVRTWADEIIVVDMHSKDRTVETAHAFGAKVYFHERTAAVEGARSFAVAQATRDWVLLLDADEIIPQPLSAKLLQIASTDAADVVIIPRLNYLLGAPLRHTGWDPREDKHARFFKKDRVEFSPEIHAFIRPVPGARLLTLSGLDNAVMHHFNYLDSEHFLQKLNRYTTVEAEEAFARGEQAGMMKAAYRALKEFASRYIYKQGFRDGWRGFYLSGFMAMYRFSSCAKLQELHTSGGRGEIAEKYRRAAEETIAGYRADDLHVEPGRNRDQPIQP